MAITSRPAVPTLGCGLRAVVAVAKKERIRSFESGAGFAAATVGGFTSPVGAVVGGLLVGVTENLVGTYVSFIGTELKLTVALAMIIIVLLVRPAGLFGRTTIRRV